PPARAPRPAVPACHGGRRRPLGFRACGPLLRGVGQLLAQLAALPLERRALELERAERLRQALDRLLQLSHGVALRHQPVAHFLLERCPTRQLLAHRPEVALGSRALGLGRRPLALGLLRAPRLLLAPPTRGGAALAGVA